MIMMKIKVQKNDIMNDGVTIENRFSKLVEKWSNFVECTSSSDLLSVIDETFIQKIKISAESDNSGTVYQKKILIFNNNE